MTTELIRTTIERIIPLRQDAMEAARHLQGQLTKPAGSLGELEELSIRLSGLAGVCPPPLLDNAALAIFAADHGVHAQGVTPWPQEVTAQMVGNFLAGGAAVNAIARQTGVSVTVVDVGINADIEAPQLIGKKVRKGTRDMTAGMAMTREEAETAIEAGITVAGDLIANGANILLTGDMGIANTTASAALISAICQRDPGMVTGYGTGIDNSTHARKIEVIKSALERHQLSNEDPIGVLAAVGGLEHGALAGFILGAAAHRVPILLDGVIAVAAALVAHALAPDCREAMIAGHRSVEPGATIALGKLDLAPLLELGMRLGEGTGAALAYPIVAASVRVLHEMATFGDAGVSEK